MGDLPPFTDALPISKNWQVGDAASGLEDDLRIELLALTKVVLSWDELVVEFEHRGFELRLQGDELLLAQGSPEERVICNVGALGFGATLRQLSRRLGRFQG
ncbi:TPA: hypothetical protein VDU83_002703 [Pseudomonas aeruginosa]|nr:hypothetical protein [Pseudomonas aeruginosa]